MLDVARKPGCRDEVAVAASVLKCVGLPTMPGEGTLRGLGVDIDTRGIRR